MSDTKSLNGLTPARNLGSGANSTGTNQYPVSSSTSPSIFTGDIVSMIGGVIVRTTVDGAIIPIGVFQGARWDQDGEPKWGTYWPGGTSATNARAYVVDNPHATFFIQADASANNTVLMGSNYQCTGITDGSTITGRSGVGLAMGTSRSTTDTLVRPIAYKNEPGNSSSSAYPIFEVEWVKHQLTTASATPAGT